MNDADKSSLSLSHHHEILFFPQKTSSELVNPGDKNEAICIQVFLLDWEPGWNNITRFSVQSEVHSLILWSQFFRKLRTASVSGDPDTGSQESRKCSSP